MVVTLVIAMELIMNNYQYKGTWKAMKLLFHIHCLVLSMLSFAVAGT